MSIYKTGEFVQSETIHGLSHEDFLIAVISPVSRNIIKFEVFLLRNHLTKANKIFIFFLVLNNRFLKNIFFF
jgi:hypothetical protein